MMDDETGSEFGVYAKRDGREVRLAMQELWLSGTVLPIGARLVVRHVFQSAEETPLEVIYAFVLPRDAAMRSFRIVGDGFECHSELRPVDEAEEIYEVGVEGGHLSVLAKGYRDGLVNLNVGNVRPGETVTVYLEIVAGVEAHDNGFRFRFPFTLAPSYHPRAGRSLSPDGIGEISLPTDEFGDVVLPPWHSDAESLHRVGFNLSVDIPDMEVQLASPSHPISVLECGRKIELAVEGDVPNRDLVLDVHFNAVKPVVFAGTDATGRGRLTAIVPSTCFGDAEGEPRRTVFLIDRSGSMGGKSMQQALKATAACLGALTEADCFGVVVFDNTTEMLAPELLPATKRNREAAKSFLSGISARGGTELAAGVACAAKVLGNAGGDIVLLTDGQVYGSEDIIARARRLNTRLHCLGIGSASQDRFLTLLVRATGGVSRFVTPRERVDMALLEVFASSGVPVAKGLYGQPLGEWRLHLAPRPASLVYSGAPLVLMGSFDGTEGGQLQIGWSNMAGEHTLTLPVLPEDGPLGEALRALQGARLITDAESGAIAPFDGVTDPDDVDNVLEHLCSMGTKGAEVGVVELRPSVEQATRNPLEATLMGLSEEYGLANRAMALVAMVKRKGGFSGRLPRTQVVPIGIPEDSCFGRPSDPSHGMLASVSSLSSLSSMSALSTMSPPLYGAVVDTVGAPSELGGVRMLFRKKVPREAAREQTTLEDLLVEFVAAIEPDGGAPGADSDQRVAATLLLLILLHESGYAADGGAFSAHVRRLTTFLEGAKRDGLPEARRALVKLLMHRLNESKPMAGPWTNLALDYSKMKEMWRPGEFWKIAARVAAESYKA